MEDEQKAKRERFIEASRPLMKLLVEEYHPHHVVIVTSNRAELSEGVVAFASDEYILD